MTAVAPSPSIEIHPIRVPFQIAVSPDRTIDRFVYVYLLISGNEACLIDSGVSACAPMLRERLSALPENTRLSTLLLTHAHPDHIGGGAPLLEAHTPVVAAHPSEREWIEDVAKQKAERPVPGFDGLVAGSLPVHRTLEDGDTVSVGTTAVQVLHTPGHSPGSLSFYIESLGALFSGDAIPQPGAMPIYTDAEASYQSVQKLRALPSLRVIYSSWDDPCRDKDAETALIDGLKTLHAVHNVVQDALRTSAASDSRTLCRACVAALGLPPVAANPLTAVTFESHRSASLPELSDR